MRPQKALERKTTFALNFGFGSHEAAVMYQVERPTEYFVGWGDGGGRASHLQPDLNWFQHHLQKMLSLVSDHTRQRASLFVAFLTLIF